jgi:signal peptidase I
MRMDRVSKESEQKKLLRQIWLGLLLRTGLLVLTVWIVFTYVFSIRIASSNDMYPAIREGDLVVLYRLGSYSREDVVEYTVAGERRLGRIVGTEGTQIGTTADGRLTLDGRFLPVQPRQGIYEETMAEVSEEDTGDGGLSDGSAEETSVSATSEVGRSDRSADEASVSATGDGERSDRNAEDTTEAAAAAIARSTGDATEVSEESNNNGERSDRNANEETNTGVVATASKTAGEESVVPAGSFYILGDRRGDATDSRILGSVPESQICGKVFMLWRRRGI